MRTLRLIAVSFIFAAIFSVSAFAQTTGDRVGLVNWAVFEDEKAGITKYTGALKALDTEFEPLRAELQKMANSYQALQKEIQGFQDLLNQNKPIPISRDEVQKKVDQLSQMDRDIKFKQEDAKARYQTRFNAVVGPVQADIIKAMGDFATAKGFAVILDGAKLEEAGILLAFNQKSDVTKDFITYYNTRPATTATK